MTELGFQFRDVTLQNSCPYLCGFWSRSILRIHSCKFSVSSFFIPVTSPRSSSWELDYFFILKSFSFLSSNCILVSSSSKSFHFSSSSVPHTQSDTGILQALALHSLPLTVKLISTDIFTVFYLHQVWYKGNHFNGRKNKGSKEWGKKWGGNAK